MGGMNLLEFRTDGSVVCERVVASPENLAAFHRSLMLFYTGRPRQSGDSILAGQGRAAANGDNAEDMKAMRDLAYEMRDMLEAGDVEAMGEALHRNYELKLRAAPGTSTPEIDEFYGRAREAGAWGGKLLGAGGGGFFLLAAPPEEHAGLRSALRDFREIAFRFAGRGSHMLLLEQD
jgi:D-glycero-alpha-D-manno-heptose-7-phosphate kinase